MGSVISSSDALLHRLRLFVLAESSTQKAKMEDQWSRLLSERVEKGWAIEGVQFVGFENRNISLNCPVNNSRFREGDLLVLHNGDPMDPNALHVKLENDDDTELSVRLQSGSHYLLHDSPKDLILDQDWLDLSGYYLVALDKVAESDRGRSIILPLLQGVLTPKFNYSSYENALIKLGARKLNKHQADAAALSYSSESYHSIQGPPGTGKTYVLAHIARLLVEDDHRVLVTSLTHRAINNALNKIAVVDERIPVCKIGDGSHTSDLLVPNFECFSNSPFVDSDAGYIIGATPFALQTSRLANIEFDTVIFDEASQITLPLAIMGMLAGDKYIFIGDEKQLPPVTIFSANEAAQSSIFGYLAGRGNETMLDISFRLNDKLANWPSRMFYNGELKPSIEAGPRLLKLSDNPTRWDTVLDPSNPMIFLDLRHHNATIRSRDESIVIVELIFALLSRGVKAEEIGVVVPYRAQSRVIRNVLRHQIDDADCSKIVVDTVERMQGQEREVILFSLTTSSPAFAEQMAEFLFQPQRLNVAVTRPRTKLILVGSSHILDASNYNKVHTESFNLLRSLLNECHVITM